MKLKEVLPHLRAGGRVIVKGGLNNPKLNLDQLLRSYVTTVMLDLDFEIVKDPYKREYILKCDAKGGLMAAGEIILPDLSERKNKKYKIIIEEIV